jgi:hypothetical protein
MSTVLLIAWSTWLAMIAAGVRSWTREFLAHRDD